MKKIAHILFCTIFLIGFSLEAKQNASNSPIVTATKKINIANYPEAFNPSIIRIEGGFLLCFRHCLYPKYPQYPHVSYIGIVKLDNNLNVVAGPQILNTREQGATTPSQAEDARLFAFNNKIYLIYNDNIRDTKPSIEKRRDMFIAELQLRGSNFHLNTPLKLFHEKKYNTVKWQKNWVPFEWNNNLMMGYSIGPHEILQVDLSTGLSKIFSDEPSGMNWKKGALRGGTPAILMGDHYLAFFHSSIEQTSTASEGKKMHHYFMGAYTFSSNPPFRIEKISPSPIIGDGFYTKSSCDKRVIFPGGFTVVNNQIYVAYGKDDTEVWVATLNKKSLMKSLKTTKKHR